MTLTQLTDHVWIWPCLAKEAMMQPNVGVVIGQSETVLIDAGNGAPHAQQIKNALQEMGAPPVRHIIFTHHHWDHVFGAYLFDAQVIANVRSVPFLREKRRASWGEPFLQERWERYPRMREEVMYQRQAAGNWDELQIVLPEITFEEAASFVVDGDIQLKMWHVGGMHAFDSIVVQVVQERVMFVGDSFYAPPTYEQEPDQEDTIAVEVIHRFLRDDVALYVDGHNKPYSHKQMQLLIRWQMMKQASMRKSLTNDETGDYSTI